MDAQRLADLELLSSLVHRVLGACRPVVKVARSRVVPLGSCVLFEIESRLFLGSASHVVSEAIREGQPVAVVAEEGRYAPLRGTIFGSEPTVNDHRIDFAAVLCDDLTRDALHGTPRLSASLLDVEHRSVGERRERYVVQGFPLSKVSRPTRDHRAFGSFLLTTYAAPLRTYPLLQIREETHLAVAYDAKSSTNADGHKAPSVKGVSGGAVWAIRDDTQEPSAHDARLVAFAIEHHPVHKAIVAVRVGVLIEMIRANAPDLVSSLPQPRFRITSS